MADSMTADQMREEMRKLFEERQRLPESIPVGPTMWAAYREAFCAIGPRHRIIDRWRYDLGWEVSSDVAAPFLAPHEAADMG